MAQAGSGQQELPDTGRVFPRRELKKGTVPAGGMFDGETAHTACGNAAAACINRGNQLLKSQPAQAAGAYATALQYDPGSAVAHYGLGMAYRALGRTDDAIQAWEWVASSSPGTTVAADARKDLAAVRRAGRRGSR